MKTIRIDKYGGPDVLQCVTVDIPKPAKDQVLIKVFAAGVNPADTYMRYDITAPW